MNFNNFGQFFLKFVTKFPNFWKISLSFLVWETILTSKNLFWLEIFPLSYKERRIKKIEFHTSSTCKFASWTLQGKHKQSKFSANRLELARNTKCYSKGTASNLARWQDLDNFEQLTAKTSFSTSLPFLLLP